MTSAPAKTPVELGPFAARVIAWMDEHKMSGREMAKRCKLSPSYFTTLRSGKTGIPSMRTIEAISAEMKEDLFPYAMMANPGDPIQPERNVGFPTKELEDTKSISTNVRTASDIPLGIVTDREAMPLDVPVYGISVGGMDHDFRFNGNTIEYVRRPPGLSRMNNVFALYVVGVSMYPAYRENSLIFINKDRVPAIGDDVVIELFRKSDGHDDEAELPGPAFIKRLVRRSGSKVVVEQFNPPQEIEIDRSEIKEMFRVVPIEELLGV